MIRHIVVWKFAPYAQGATAQENARIMKERLEALAPRIDGLVSLHVGLDIGDPTHYHAVLELSLIHICQRVFVTTLVFRLSWRWPAWINVCAKRGFAITFPFWLRGVSAAARTLSKPLPWVRTPAIWAPPRRWPWGAIFAAPVRPAAATGASPPNGRTWSNA